MALSPDSAPSDAGEPIEYARDHPQERATKWGWHGEWGAGTRGGGWVVAVVLLLMSTATNYQFEYELTLWTVAGVIVVMLLVDRSRRRNRWPK